MKLRLGVVIAAAVTAVSAACGGSTGSAGPAQAPTPGGEVLAQGESPRQNQYTNEAAGYLEEAQEAQEADPAAAEPLLRQAVDAAQMAIDEDPRNPLPWYQQGVAYLQLDDFAMADSTLRVAEELRPIYQLETEGIRERAWIQKYQEAVPAVDAQRFDEAVAILEEANVIYDSRPEVYLTLGQLYSQLDRPMEAVQALRSAEAIIQSERFEDMDSTTQAEWRASGERIPAMIAQALMQAGDYGAAASAIRGLLADDPENVDLLGSLAQVYVLMEQPDSARVVYARLLDLPDLETLRLYGIGVGYYQIDDYDEAIRAFSRAVEQSPQDRDAVEMLNRSLQLAYLADREEDDALPPAVLQQIQEASERWQDLDPYNTFAYMVEAQVANIQGDSEEAARLIERIQDSPVVVQNLQLQRYQEGGGIVTGQVMNQTLDQGTPITMEFTFFGPGNSVIGTETVELSSGPAESPTPFQIDFQIDQAVTGYSYELTTG